MRSEETNQKRPSQGHTVLLTKGDSGKSRDLSTENATFRSQVCSVAVSR